MLGIFLGSLATQGYCKKYSIFPRFSVLFPTNEAGFEKPTTSKRPKLVLSTIIINIDCCDQD